MITIKERVRNMKIFELFNKLSNKKLSKNNVDHIRIYMEDKHYKNFIYNYSIMYNTTRAQHCCMYSTCCLYNSKTNELQLFNLKTNSFQILTVKKHELTEEQEQLITNVVEESLNYWFNLYNDDNKDEFSNICRSKELDEESKLKDNEFRSKYFSNR